MQSQILVQEALETMDLEWLDLTQLAGLLTALPDEREATMVRQYLEVCLYLLCLLLNKFYHFAA